MTVELAHTESGPADAPPVLLANAIGTSAAIWDAQLALMEEHFRVVRFDHRGQGRSPVPVGPYRIDDLVSDVLRLLDDLGVVSAHFAGLSLGGMVGMSLAAQAPARVDRLALLCTSARLEPAANWRTRAAAVRAGDLPQLAPSIVGRWFTPAFALRRPDVVRRFTSMLLESPTEGYAWCCDAIAEFDATAELSRIRAPTLVVAAADDLAIPVENSRRLVEGIAGARLAVVSGAAHLPNVEQPAAVGALLVDHLLDRPMNPINSTNPVRE